MSRLPHVRQIVDSQPNPGNWNMAVDEVLLQTAIERDVATLRWYQWREPTASLGYFQKVEEVEFEPRLSGLPRVRRLSGGGTLVHDQELTYSLALPASQRLIERPVDLYRLVHQVFIDVFKRRGIDLNLRGATLKRTAEPVLCFAREDENDLVLAGHKVLGSAQRRRRGAILQHGGLLLRASKVTPELLGIVDLAPRGDLSSLSADLGDSLLQEISESRENGSLDAAEIAATELIMATRVDSR